MKQDLAAGEEALRAYGDEWLAIKYYHLKAFLNKRKETIGTFTFFVDMHTLQIQNYSSDEKEPESIQDISEELLRLMNGRDIVAVSLPVLAFFEKCIGLLALDRFQKGNRSFDIAWTRNLENLKAMNY